MNVIPRVKFAHLPTPVEPLERLTKYFNGPKIFVKRDDQTGLAFGGNKVRKLEFLVAEAMAQGAKTLITAGAVQSNHCRQTAAVAARFGIGCILVLAGEKTKHISGNLMLDQLLGARIVWTTHSELDSILNKIFNETQKAGHRPYLIPFGGSNPVGVAGYVFAMSELREQSFQPDWIIVPSGSGGTQAGMVVGSKMFGFKGKILGISVIEQKNTFQAKVKNLAQASADILGEHIQISLEDILINSDYLGEGYGIMGAPEQDAIRLFAKQEGLILDPVYTGRAAAGMIDLLRLGYFSRDEQILFWHTGGSPALFIDSYSDKII
jgi:D-cysteine desulfhydrase family pyridoxal phosphate-dependent enzyme